MSSRTQFSESKTSECLLRNQVSLHPLILTVKANIILSMESKYCTGSIKLYMLNMFRTWLALFHL